MTRGAHLCSARTLLAVKNLKEISCVLRNSLERRRGRILWPEKEEENIMGKIQLALRTTQQPLDKYLEESRRLYCLTNCLDEIFGISIINSHLSPSHPSPHRSYPPPPTSWWHGPRWSSISREETDIRLWEAVGRRYQEEIEEQDEMDRQLLDLRVTVPLPEVLQPDPSLSAVGARVRWALLRKKLENDWRVQSSHTIYLPASPLK